MNEGINDVPNSIYDGSNGNVVNPPDPMDPTDFKTSGNYSVASDVNIDYAGTTQKSLRSVAPNQNKDAESIENLFKTRRQNIVAESKKLESSKSGPAGILLDNKKLDTSKLATKLVHDTSKELDNFASKQLIVDDSDIVNIKSREAISDSGNPVKVTKSAERIVDRTKQSEVKSAEKVSSGDVKLGDIKSTELVGNDLNQSSTGLDSISRQNIQASGNVSVDKSREVITGASGSEVAVDKDREEISSKEVSVDVTDPKQVANDLSSGSNLPTKELVGGDDGSAIDPYVVPVGKDTNVFKLIASRMPVGKNTNPGYDLPSTKDIELLDGLVHMAIRAALRAAMMLLEKKLVQWMATSALGDTVGGLIRSTMTYIHDPASIIGDAIDLGKALFAKTPDTTNTTEHITFDGTTEFRYHPSNDFVTVGTERPWKRTQVSDLSTDEVETTNGTTSASIKTQLSEIRKKKIQLPEKSVLDYFAVNNLRSLNFTRNLSLFDNSRWVITMHKLGALTPDIPYYSIFNGYIPAITFKLSTVGIESDNIDFGLGDISIPGFLKQNWSISMDVLNDQHNEVGNWLVTYRNLINNRFAGIGLPISSDLFINSYRKYTTIINVFLFNPQGQYRPQLFNNVNGARSSGNNLSTTGYASNQNLSKKYGRGGEIITDSVRFPMHNFFSFVCIPKLEDMSIDGSNKPNANDATLSLDFNVVGLYDGPPESLT